MQQTGQLPADIGMKMADRTDDPPTKAGLSMQKAKVVKRPAKKIVKRVEGLGAIHTPEKFDHQGPEYF